MLGVGALVCVNQAAKPKGKKQRVCVCLCVSVLPGHRKWLPDRLASASCCGIARHVGDGAYKHYTIH